MSLPIVECVPNVSEGRRPEVIAALATAICSVPGVSLLHQDAGAGANRTVFTFAGPPAAVKEAAFRLFTIAAEHIDMRQHQGTHPRMGAVDVCPFVPVRDCNLDDCVSLAHALGERVWKELGIPVYFYESAATAPHRRNLAKVRSGEYESLATKMQLPDWQVDHGSSAWNPRTGTSIIGARPFLIAWNINLATDDVKIAQKLAGQIRASGTVRTNATGEKTRYPGLFTGLKAIGWHIEEYGRCQISTNVVDPERVNLLAVYQTCQKLAKEFATEVTGSELIGLIPAKYLLAAGKSYEEAVENLGLADLADFDWRERVLEEKLASSA